MIFLDSWIWLEFLFDGDTADEAEATILRANEPDEGGLISPTVTAEVAYRIRVVEDETTATEAIDAIRDYDHVENVPINDRLAEYAAALRHKYYEPGDCELSYADAIHLATASSHDDCHALYTGDPDFATVDEVEPVIL